jgi:outer membrane protein TolC
VAVELAVGIPADAIRQRPDIRSAERNLAAQTARTGEAMAQRWPSFNLSGSIGLEALSLSDLISAPTRIWSLGSALGVPLFNANAIGSNIKVYEERQAQALIEYKTAILAALEEVENALVDYAKDYQKMAHLNLAVAAARTASQLAEQQYTTGLTDFSNVLEAQRALLSFEDQLAELRGTLLSDVVRLYKALGGGWQSFLTPSDRK